MEPPGRRRQHRRNQQRRQRDAKACATVVQAQQQATMNSVASTEPIRNNRVGAMRLSSQDMAIAPIR